MLKTLIYKLLSLQEAILRKYLSGTLGVKNVSKYKRHYLQGNSVDLSVLADQEKQILEKEIMNILSKYSFQPDEILKYVESQGTGVYLVDGISLILNIIGEQEGFITPATGLKAGLLSLVTSHILKLNTDAMFIFSKKNINKYYFFYQFYNWFAYKHNFDGLDRKSIKLLNKCLYSQLDTKKIQLADIYKLKDAIKQDKNAIEFVIKLSRKFDGTKQVINKIRTNGCATL